MSSNDCQRCDEKDKEIERLEKVVSNKDKQIEELQELVQTLSIQPEKESKDSDNEDGPSAAKRQKKYRQNLSELNRNIVKYVEKLQKRAKLPKLEEGYQPVGDYRVLTARISQYDRMFERQEFCLTFSLVAACYGDPSLWTSDKLEQMLSVGCFFYEKVRLENNYVNQKIRQLEIMDFQAMGGVVEAFGVKSKFQVVHLSPLGGPIQGDLTSSEDQHDDFGIPLLVALRRLFLNYDRGVLLCNNKWISIAQCESGGYAVTNSHAVNDKNAPDGKNNARAFLCKSTQDLVDLIAASFTANSFYNLYPMIITRN